MNMMQVALLHYMHNRGEYSSYSNYTLVGTPVGTMPGESGSRYQWARHQFREVTDPILSGGIQNPLLNMKQSDKSNHDELLSINLPKVLGYVDIDSKQIVINTDLVTSSTDESLAQPTPEPLPEPPLKAEFILHIFVRREERDAIIGDLIERYGRMYKRFGERRTKIWFYSEIARSVWPFTKHVIGRISGLIVLGEWIRRYIS
jgi:hypothetical protein